MEHTQKERESVSFTVLKPQLVERREGEEEGGWELQIPAAASFSDLHTDIYSGSLRLQIYAGNSNTPLACTGYSILFNAKCS